MKKEVLEKLEGIYPKLDFTRYNDTRYLMDTLSVSMERANTIKNFIDYFIFKENMKLVYAPHDRNWAYYYDTEMNFVFCIAKTDEYNSGTFGDLKYFKNFLLKEIIRDESLSGSITTLGFKILNDKLVA